MILSSLFFILYCFHNAFFFFLYFDKTLLSKTKKGTYFSFISFLREQLLPALLTSFLWEQFWWLLMGWHKQNRWRYLLFIHIFFEETIVTDFTDILWWLFWWLLIKWLLLYVTLKIFTASGLSTYSTGLNRAFYLT